MISDSNEQSVTGEHIDNIEPNSSANNQTASHIVNIQDANKIEESLSSTFVEKYNFNNSPTEYHALKSEAKFLSEMTNYLFLLLAHRLINIKDGKLYEQQQYKDFNTYLDHELSIPKTVVTTYMDLVNFFGVKTFEDNPEVEPAKLIPALPLLKSKNAEVKKELVKENFIAKSKSHTAKAMKQEADFFKMEYNLKKEREPNIVSTISSFLKKMPKELSDQQKEELKSLTDQQKEDLKFIAEQLTFNS